MLKNKKLKNIAVVMENIEYGGVTTHLINLINSNKFKKNNFIIITNNENKAVKQIIKACSKEKVNFFFLKFNSCKNI